MRGVSSRDGSESKRCSATHFARARYGAGISPSRSTSSANVSSSHLNDMATDGEASVLATQNILPPTLKTRSAPHWICSVAPGRERQRRRRESRVIRGCKVPRCRGAGVPGARVPECQGAKVPGARVKGRTKSQRAVEYYQR